MARTNSSNKSITASSADVVLTVLFGAFGYWRFRRGEAVLGLIWLFTFGLFGIGWLVDIVLACSSYSNANKVNAPVKTGTQPVAQSSNTPLQAASSPHTQQQPTKGNLLYEKLVNYTVIDLETSSKYANQANIIELAAVRVRRGKIVAQYSTLIRPPEGISDQVSQITGITNEMLESAPPLEQKLGEYLQFIGNDVLLGHNIRAYDVNVLNYACKALHLPLLGNNMLDTLHYARKCRINVISYRLPALARYFRIQYDAHRALNDCIANHYVYEKLKPTYIGVYHTARDKARQSTENMQNCTIHPEYADIAGKSIVLTGDFMIADEDAIRAKLESLGAFVKKDVSGKTDYLIIGSLGSDRWYYGTYGRKIEKAMELQEQGKPIIMVEEDMFFDYENHAGVSTG